MSPGLKIDFARAKGLPRPRLGLLIHGGFGGDAPVVGIGVHAPAVHLLADGIDDGGVVVALGLGGQAKTLVEQGRGYHRDRQSADDARPGPLLPAPMPAPSFG